MIGILLKAAATLALVGGILAAKRATGPKQATPPERNIGDVALWGVPDSGKSTFVAQLRSEPLSPQKEQTRSANKYTDVVVKANGQRFTIAKIVDMPGTEIRKGDWLKLASTARHSIYLVNLSEYFGGNIDYVAAVNQHLKDLRGVFDSGNKDCSSLIILGTHLDKSRFSNVPAPDNAIHADASFEKLIALVSGSKTPRFYSGACPEFCV